MQVSTRTASNKKIIESLTFVSNEAGFRFPGSSYQGAMFRCPIAGNWLPGNRYLVTGNLKTC
jgi:hypothetical protein